MNRHKLLFATSAELPNRSAHSGNIYRTAGGLAGHGIEVELLSRKGQTMDLSMVDDEIFDYFGVRHSFNMTAVAGSRLRFVTRLIKILLYGDFDAVYTREVWIAFLASLFNRRVGWHAHSSFDNSSKARIKLQMVRAGHFHVFVVSEGMKKLFKNDYRIADHRLKVIRNGVDLETFAIPTSREQARKCLGLKEDVRICVYAGHLFPGRGIEIIIEVAKRLPDVIFIMVGGNLKDIDDYKKLSSENVKYIGHVSHQQVAMYLRAANLLLMPYQEKVGISGGRSHNASILGPLKIYEYMASGTPVIASDLTFVREVMSEQHAILVACNDTDAWVREIQLNFENPSANLKRGKNAAKLAHSFDIHNTTKKTISSLFGR